MSVSRITLAQAATRCGLSARSLRQAAELNRLRAEKFGKTWITTDAWLRQYLDSRHQGNFTRGDTRLGSRHKAALSA